MQYEKTVRVTLNTFYMYDVGHIGDDLRSQSLD